MSVERRLEIRVITNIPLLSQFIKELTKDFFHFENESGTYCGISIEDDEDFDYQVYSDIQTMNIILDTREKNKKENAIIFWDKEYSESFGVLIYPLDNDYEGFKKHYLFSFALDSARRMSESSRFTDYGYYLNKILPEFMKIDCNICEIKCHDFDF